MFFENISEALTVATIVKTVAIGLLLGTLMSLFEKRHIFRFAGKHGGHRFYPLIGNGYHVIGKDIFTAVRTIIGKYGLPSNMWLGHDYNYISADASEIKVILNHPNSMEKMKLYDTFKMGFSNSLLIAPVDLWKRHRKFLSKSFSQPLLNSFVHSFYMKSNTLLEVLKNADHKDVFQIFEKYTFDSFCESIVGKDYSLQINPKVDIVAWMGELQAIGGRRLITNFYFPTLLWVLFGEGRYAISLLGKGQRFVYDIMKEKRAALAENPVCVDSSLPLPFLDAMLQAEGEKFSDKEIFQEFFFFAMAATDTSGFTMAYTFTLLGMHKEIQEKVYQEVISVVGLDRPIYYEDLPNLKYTERAILEALRILPVTPILGRLATADIDIGTKVIPKGANFLISVLDLHRNEKYWPKPLQYDPDRFLPEEVLKRDPYTYMPFSGGPKNCLGKTYSIMLMKTAIANVIRNYEIASKYKSVSELKVTSCITMKTIHPLDCRFKPRVHD